MDIQLIYLDINQSRYIYVYPLYIHNLNDYVHHSA